MKLPLAAAAVGLALLVPAAGATDWCNGNEYLHVAVGAGDVNAAYVVYDCWNGCMGQVIALWMHAESNGEPGLQRGGVTLLGDADVCQDSANPDTGIF